MAPTAQFEQSCCISESIFCKAHGIFQNCNRCLDDDDDDDRSLLAQGLVVAKERQGYGNRLSLVDY